MDAATWETCVNLITGSAIVIAMSIFAIAIKYLWKK